MYIVFFGRRLLAAVCGFVFGAAAGVLLLSAPGRRPAAAPDVSGGGAAFLRALGWEAEPAPEEDGDVALPPRFDGIYAEYNALNLARGFDLRPYAGRTVRRYTFRVLNYPGWEGDPSVRAHLLTLDGRVIGGDLCSLRPDGFMEGLWSRYGEDTAG